MSMGLDKEDLLSMSRVKGKLGAIFLSDMVTADGKHLETFACVTGDLEVPQSKFNFPREVPTDRDWEVWKTFGVNTQWRTSNFTRPWEPKIHAHTEDESGITTRDSTASRRRKVQTQNSTSQQDMPEHDPTCSTSRLGQARKSLVENRRPCKCWKEQEFS